MPNQQPRPAAGQHPQPEQLAGLVESVTFHSDESDYCVLRIKACGHRDLVTVVGTLPEVRAGEWLEAQGRWIVNKEYGQQFEAQILRTAHIDPAVGGAPTQPMHDPNIALGLKPPLNPPNLAI
jgi:exodeoxyribonuclease V alpha subunit